MKRVGICISLLGLSFFQGCCNPPARTVVVAPPPGPTLMPQQPATFGSPAPFPTTPVPAGFGQPAPAPTAPPPGARLVAPLPPPPSITAPPGPSSSNRIEGDWQAAGGNEPAPANPSIRLYAPEVIDKQPAPSTKEPPLAKKPSVQASFPSIPQFAVAKDNVYTGLRPALDGLDWLEQTKVRTVVNVRAGDTDDSTDRAQVEQRKMQYVPFTVSPQTLTKEKADEFIKLIRDGSKQGIFVYDQDGSLTGSLWYLYFRLGEFLDDDAAQLRAGQLGLRPGAAGRQGDMWVAVQKLLSENSR